MKIEDYSFGRIVIDGKPYTSDVIILPERVIHPWWRESGHRLGLKDLGEALGIKPRVLIIGTGSAGAMAVPEHLRESLRQQGVELMVEKTGEAVRSYNRLADQPGTAAALHLTC